MRANYIQLLIATLPLTFLSGYCDTALTIYNGNYAVVRESIELNLKKGLNNVSNTEVTRHLEPDSVIVRDPAGKTSFSMLEQNYRADPVSQGLLLSAFEGKEIDFEKGSNIIRGKIIRSGYVSPSRQRHRSNVGSGGAIIESDGLLQFGLPGKPLFPSLGGDSILKPTLHWLIDSKKKRSFDAELSYITGGLTWEADYNLVVPEKGQIGEMNGWITMDNQSGKTFRDTSVKLMAGDVNKVQDHMSDVFSDDPFGGRVMAARAAPAVTEKSFDEFHLYSLHRKTTLRDQEKKQVEFLSAKGVHIERIYVYDGANINHHNRSWANLRRNREYGVQSDTKVAVFQEIENTDDNGLGIALPKGKVRFYRQDSDGQLEFTGEDVIDHTPQDETLRMYTGNAFDLVGERTRTFYKVNTDKKWAGESFEIKVRNRKEHDSVEIRVVEHLYRGANWKIMDTSHDHLKMDAQTIEFRVKIPAGGEETISYQAHYTW